MMYAIYLHLFVCWLIDICMYFSICATCPSSLLKIVGTCVLAICMLAMLLCDMTESNDSVAFLLSATKHDFGYFATAA